MRLESIFIDERPDERIRLARVADLGLREELLQSIDQLVSDTLMDDQSAERRAALTGRAGSGEEDCPRRQLQIGARTDDHGVVSAQFEQHAPKSLRDTWADFASHSCRPGR